MSKSPFKLLEATGHYIVERPVSSDDILTQAKLFVADRLSPGTFISNPRDSSDYLAVQFSTLEHEVFACLFLDTRHRVLSYQELFRGTIDGCSVHPREIVKSALQKNAAAVIFAHNHPSGVAEPSQSDTRLTQRLKDALALVDVRVLDHLIVGGGDVISMAERGII